jgi:DNA primase
VNAWTAAFLSSLTDKFLLLPDHDIAGEETYKKTLDNFKYYKVKVEVLKTSHKDFDDVYRFKDEVEPKRALMKLRNM